MTKNEILRAWRKAQRKKGGCVWCAAQAREGQVLCDRHAKLNCERIKAYRQKKRAAA